jgi:putative flippase GtrA
MTFGSSRIGAALQRRLQTSVGKRFSRFILVAAGAVIASQITLTVCLGPVGWTAGRSAVAAWMAGAAVSYVLSRWAWERKGRPNLLKETLPFWVVSVGTAVVLTLTTKWANQQAIAMGLSHAERVLFADAAYFLANCVTFLTRFLIFHYVLFKDRGAKVSELISELPASERPGARGESAGGAHSTGGGAHSTGGGAHSTGGGAHSTGDGVVASEPFAAAGSAAGVNGSSAWAGNAAERSPGRAVPARGDAALPEPGTRR